MTAGLTGDFNDPDTHWKGSTAGFMLSSRCRASLGTTPLHRCQAKKGDAHLNLVLAREGMLIMDVETSISLGCSGHEIVGEDFSLFRALFVVVPWAAALQVSSGHYSWSFSEASSKHRNCPDC